MEFLAPMLAANDSIYRASRHRSLPIAKTIFFIPGYPQKLRIFLTNASCYWQARCYFKGKTYTQTLRTQRRKEAMLLARDFYHRMVAKVYGEYYIEKTPDSRSMFRGVASQATHIEEAKVQRGELSAAGLRIFKNRLAKEIIPFFGDMAVDDINYAHLSAFVGKLSTEKASPTTISQYLVATRKVLNYAVATSLIRSLPGFPKVKPKDNPRSSFEVWEYLKLFRTARKTIGHDIPITKTQASSWQMGKVDRHFYIPEEMRWVIGFMVNSFIRPTDLRHLKYQHVQVIRGEHVYLRLNLPESKKHDKPIVTMPAAVWIYEHLKRHAKASRYGRETDYLFMPHLQDRKKAMEQMTACFKYIVRAAKLEKSPKDGSSRTLYSLRHTAITFRLRYGKGIDLLTLARNARTSVEMIERFYASNLQAEMNIEMLHSRRSRQ